MKISRIIFSGDSFRSEYGAADQSANVNWLAKMLGDLMGTLTSLPVEIKLPIVGTSVADLFSYHGQYDDISAYAWASVFNATASDKLVKIFRSDLEGALVITFEMPPLMEDALDKAQIPWIDVSISPLRFLPDWAFHIKVSRHFNLNLTLDYQLTCKLVYDYADHVKKHFAKDQPTEPCLIFFAQTIRDRTLIYKDRFFETDDLLPRINRLVDNREFFIKPHPWQSSSEIINALLTKGAIITSRNTYAILSSPFVEAFTVSSSVGREANYFNCNMKILYPDIQDWAFSGRDVLHHALNSDFWAALLNTGGIQTLRSLKRNRKWRPNFLRKSIQELTGLPVQGVEFSTWIG